MSITLGAMEPPLTEQLKGLASNEDLSHLQRDAQAITRCHIRGLISDRESDKARRRLIKRIERTLNGKTKSK